MRAWAIAGMTRGFKRTMASERQIAANRRNAARSTGPRSRAGRARAAQNAVKHGLAVPARTLPHTAAARDAIATALLEGRDDDPTLMLLAQTVAEAEIEGQRARVARAGVAERLHHALTRSPDQADAAPDPVPDLVQTLGRLDRYERRAFSRRTRALRALQAGLARTPAPTPDRAERPPVGRNA